jgi:hypothetical protein
MPAVWRNEMEIAQLVIGCLFLVHLFVLMKFIQTLVLYLAAQTNPHKNWTLSIDEFYNAWHYSYIYSLYFACSTMFTVGYGDVTPKNMWEIITILVVQVVGRYFFTQVSSISGTSSTKSVAMCRKLTKRKIYYIEEYLMLKKYLRTINYPSKFPKKYVLTSWIIK